LQDNQFLTITIIVSLLIGIVALFQISRNTLALFKRLPTLHPTPHWQQELIPSSEKNRYPALLADFETLDMELMPEFRELDNEALAAQNADRLMYVILIFGGPFVSIIVIAQLALRLPVWVDAIATIMVILLVGYTRLSQGFNYRGRYLNARLAAEQLRREYFLFLGHIGTYANEQERVQRLRQRVLEIRDAGTRR
jgi:hypothetical protein